jgi:hypothetical protein
MVLAPPFRNSQRPRSGRRCGGYRGKQVPLLTRAHRLTYRLRAARIPATLVAGVGSVPSNRAASLFLAQVLRCAAPLWWPPIRGRRSIAADCADGLLSARSLGREAPGMHAGHVWECTMFRGAPAALSISSLPAAEACDVQVAAESATERATISTPAIFPLLSRMGEWVSGGRSPVRCSIEVDRNPGSAHCMTPIRRSRTG